MCRRDVARQNHAELDALVRRRGKMNKAFALPNDAIFSYAGSIIKSGQHRVLQGRGSSVTVAGDDLDSILFLRQPSSGIVHVTAGQTSWISKLRARTIPVGAISNLYTVVPFVGAIDASHLTGDVTVTVLGSGERDGEQAVVHGALLRTG